MSLLLPDSGLLFWMTIVFLVVFFILWRWGFPSIIKMVNERKNYIDESLAKAEEANLRLANIQNRLNSSIAYWMKLLLLTEQKVNKRLWIQV